MPAAWITAGAGVAGALSSALGGVLGSGAAKKAASDQATQARLNMWAAQVQAQNTRNDLTPFMINGQNAANQLGASLPSLTAFTPTPTAPGPMDQATLDATPGYQFNLNKGLQAVQNSATARGLGVSGAAWRGAADYATGLADSTYQNQFANQQALFGNQQTIYNDTMQNKQNAFGDLYNTASLGENAGVGAGSLGQAALNTQTQANTAQGNANAAGTVGSANATNSALSGVSNSAMNYLMLNKLLGSGGDTGSNDPLGINAPGQGFKPS